MTRRRRYPIYRSQISFNLTFDRLRHLTVRYFIIFVQAFDPFLFFNINYYYITLKERNNYINYEIVK